MSCISNIIEIVEEAKRGRPFILLDDKDRENEGDLVIPAQFITPQWVNFMIKNCCGIICLAISSEKAAKLFLEPMVKNNNSSFQTPFTVSIEAKNGVTTGVSAFDRSHTILVASSPHAKPEDIVSPGHIFPLISRPNGVLERSGHTEASVDICLLAGLEPAAAICEVINPDGSMSRLPEIEKFAKANDFKIGTIADLIRYRKEKT